MIYNELADKGQLNQVLQRRLNMQGAAPAPSLMPEIGPILVLENDRPEWGWLKSEYRWGRGLATAVPPAGEHALINLSNPLNSTVIAVVDQLYLSASARFAVVETASITGVTIGSAVPGVRCDGRQPPNSITEVWSARITAATLPTRAGYLIAAQYFNQPLIIQPGYSVAVFADAAAVALTGHILWRERNAMPGELV